MWRGPAALGLAAVVDSQKKYPVARVLWGVIKVAG
jgi:hypothetical protein